MNPRGKQVYRVWCDEIGRPMPAWERLTDREQAAWSAVADYQIEVEYSEINRCRECAATLTCDACRQRRERERAILITTGKPKANRRAARTVNSVSPDSENTVSAKQ